MSSRRGQDKMPGRPGWPGPDEENLNGRPGWPGEDEENLDGQSVRSGPDDRTGSAVRSVHLHRNQRLVRILTLLFLALLVCLAFLTLPALHVQQIKVSQTRAMSREEIIAASGLQPGQHLVLGLGGNLRQWLTLRYGAAEKRLRATFPYIDKVIVTMDFPGAVRIDVSERVEVAYVAIPDGCVMIDKEGIALRILATMPEHIPVIAGVSVDSLRLGEPLAVSVPAAMHSAITLMDAIIEAEQDNRTDQPLLSQIRSIRPVGGRQLYLTLELPANGQELTILAETASDVYDDMLWLRFALAQHVLNNLGKGILDLSGDHRTFVPDG